MIRGPGRLGAPRGCGICKAGEAAREAGSRGPLGDLLEAGEDEKPTLLRPPAIVAGAVGAVGTGARRA